MFQVAQDSSEKNSRISIFSKLKTGINLANYSKASSKDGTKIEGLYCALRVWKAVRQGLRDRGDDFRMLIQGQMFDMVIDRRGNLTDEKVKLFIACKGEEEQRALFLGCIKYVKQNLEKLNMMTTSDCCVEDGFRILVKKKGVKIPVEIPLDNYTVFE